MTEKSFYLVTWSLVMATSAPKAREALDRGLGSADGVMDFGIEACVEVKSQDDIDRANARACSDVIKKDRRERKVKATA